MTKGERTKHKFIRGHTIRHHVPSLIGFLLTNQHVHPQTRHGPSFATFEYSYEYFDLIKSSATGGASIDSDVIVSLPAHYRPVNAGQ